METYLHEHAKDFEKEGIAYIDPDQRGLKFMVHTYLKDSNNHAIKTRGDFTKVVTEGYQKWRGASNYITQILLNEAFIERYNIAHGTTSTSPFMDAFYTKLKQYNYQIVLLLCIAPDEVRLNAINNRLTNQRFFQSTPEDTIAKGKMFFDRLPLYFKWADKMEIRYIEDFKQEPLLVAIFTQKDGLRILDQAGFEKVEGLYETHRKKI